MFVILLQKRIRYLSGSIETHHQNSHFFLAEHAFPNAREAKTHAIKLEGGELGSRRFQMEGQSLRRETPL